MQNSVLRFVFGLATALAIVTLSPGLAPGAGGDNLWQDQFDHAGGIDEVGDMSIRGQKLVIVGGVAPSVPGGVNDTWIVRAHDAKDNGAIEWSDSFVNPDGEVTLAGVSASGNRVFVVGSRETAGGNHRMLLRVYDGRKGTLFWEDEVDAGADDARAYDTVLHGRHGFVVGARTDSGSGLTSWWVRAYDAKTSALLWEDIPGGATTDAGGAQHVVSQGSTLIVGGVAEDGGGDTDWRIRGYKKKDSSLLWEDQYDSGNGDDLMTGIQGMGKRVVFVGNAAGVGETHMRIAAYTTKNGGFIWDKLVDEGTSNLATAVTGSGWCVFMGGEVDGDFFIRGYATFTGDQMWTDRVTGGRTNAMTAFSSKTVFAAGTLDNGADGDLFIRNYSFHTGVVEWQSTDDVDGDDAIDFIFAKGGNVFTVGEADKGGDQDWVVTNLDRQ